MGCTASKLDISEDKELNQFISAMDIELVKNSWETIQQDMEDVGYKVFQRFFEKNKSIRKLFCTKMARENSDPNDKLSEIDFDERKIRVHGYIVMEALGAAIECLDDSDKLSLLLIGIGERHVMYGVNAEMVPLLWPAITKTFQAELGTQYTPRVSQAWEHIFQYIGGKVIEGIARWHVKLKTRY